MNLYKISNEYQRLLDKEELDAIDMQELEKLHDNFEDCAIQIASGIKNIDGTLLQVEQAIAEMRDRQKSLLKKKNSLTDFLHNRLKETNINKIDKSPYFVISIKNNPMKVDDYCQADIPLIYYNIETVTTLDKKKIAEDLKKGFEVPGARLIQQTRLEIK